MTRPRPCIECGLISRNGTRCVGCYRAYHRRRNHARVSLYGGTHQATSKAARKAQPWCSVCGSGQRLSWDHEHGQVECMPCNLGHRRLA